MLKAYKTNPHLTYTEILNEHLKKFNQDIQDELKDIISKIINASIGGGAAAAAVAMSVPNLSSALYNNAKNAAKSASKVLNEHFQNQSTIAEIREILYDGYGYDELLDIKKSLPKYLKTPLAEAQINKLRTQSLKNAYIKVLEAANDKQLEKALRVALEEKARYYAYRIAVTEEQRFYTLSNAIRQREKGIKFVKWTMSSLHKTSCVCEIFATQDVGYGEGIYPLMSAPTPIYSTHPICKCRLRDLYRKPKYKKVTPSKEIPDFVSVEDILD